MSSLIMYSCRTSSPSIPAPGQALRAVEANPGTGEENIYQVEERGGQPHYSVPVRGGRTLPQPPGTPSVTVTTEDLYTHHHHPHHKPTSDQIYETLGSLSSPNQPKIPARPAWTLQLPENPTQEASPLYLMMPQFQCSQVQSSGEKKVSTGTISKTSLPHRRVSSVGRRQSLSEAGKQFFRGMSLSMSISGPGKFDNLIDENDENDSENDDVFC